MRYPFNESDNPYVSYLTIKENGVRRYGYLIIKGSVKNNGIRMVTQCLLKIEIYDRNNDVVSTNKINVLGDIAPGQARSFHSITAWPESAKTYNLSIEELRVQQ